MTREIPQEIGARLRDWNWQARLLRWGHWLLGAIAVISSVIVAAKVHSLSGDAIQWLAVSAAAATGLLTAFDLSGKGNQMRRAWRHLNAAKLRFEHEPSFSEGQLIKAYEEGEKMIGDAKAPV